MQNVAYEKWPHFLDKFAGLSRFAHRLNEMRKRMEISSDEADQKLVVPGVETVTRETNVVRELLLSVRHPERSVLT